MLQDAQLESGHPLRLTRPRVEFGWNPGGRTQWCCRQDCWVLEVFWKIRPGVTRLPPPMSAFEADEDVAGKAAGHGPAATFNTTGEDVCDCCHETSPEGWSAADRTVTAPS